VTVNAPPEGEEAAPEFVCPPLTATNSVNDTLELGDDCALTFFPASTAAAATTTTAAKQARALEPRDTNCHYTSTHIVTYTVYSISTITSTITRQEATESFSCPPMSMTNAVGDELSLNEECQLEFSPGQSAVASTSTTNSEGTNGGQLGGATNVGISKVVEGLLVAIYVWMYF
jgi:hypothetical protein